MGWKRRTGVAVAAALAAASLAACSQSGPFHQKASAASQATIGVNGYLWRATLDTLAFMPLATADPWGGTVITDWYANPEKPDERFKVTVFKQSKDATGQWADAPTSDQTESDFENAILTRARQLRLSNIGGKG